MTSELEVRPETDAPTRSACTFLRRAAAGRGSRLRPRAGDARLGRPALHAAHLGFDHPITGRRLSFETPLPDDLIEWIADLGPDEVGE